MAVPFGAHGQVKPGKAHRQRVALPQSSLCCLPCRSQPVLPAQALLTLAHTALRLPPGGPCSFVQGAAAAQNGISVVQPNVGRLHDWYNRHPGVIRDPNVSSAGAGGSGLGRGAADLGPGRLGHGLLTRRGCGRTGGSSQA